MSALAVAGTHAVLLGMNVTEEGRKGLLGFSIERSERYNDGPQEGHWGANSRELTGWLTFKETEKHGYFEPDYFYAHHKQGSGVHTHRVRAHPIQDFKWGDYTAKPGTRYLYRIFPRYGKPVLGEDLEAGSPVILHVETERVDDPDDIHDVYFNRGAVASQAFVRRFPHLNTKGALQEAIDAPRSRARRWLSRGLEEAMLGFIGNAKSSRWGLRCALFEFTYDPVIQALGKAHDRGADVHILFACKRKADRKTPADETASGNIGALQEALKKNRRIKSIVTERDGTGVPISHNKFMVLLHNDRPVAVWTGSTNITMGGIFGQSNVGHVVRDEVTAQHYLKYWEVLAQDPVKQPGGTKTCRFGGNDLRRWNDEHFPVNPGGEVPRGTRVVFSPRGYGADSQCPYEALNCYASLLNGAQSGVFLTAAFGVSKEFTEMLGRDRHFLRYVLLDNPGKKGKGRDKGSLDRTAEILADKRNRVAIGAAVPANAVEGWHEETASPINGFVRYVHTKFMLIDPLSDYPTVISGSANFSENSTLNNDENMLIVEGNTRVADIYLTEYMRVWTHFQFRDEITGSLEAAAKAETQKEWEAAGKKAKQAIKDFRAGKLHKIYLDSTDGWTAKFFEEGSVEAMERDYFSGEGRAYLSDTAVGGRKHRRSRPAES